jgi:hypothetical protein
MKMEIWEQHVGGSLKHRNWTQYMDRWTLAVGIGELGFDRELCD